MNFISKSRFGKLLVSTCLSLTLVFSAGSMFLNTPAAHAATSKSTANNIIAKGKQFLGVPYRHGAKSGRTDIFDCSSFTQYVYKQNGIRLPRSSRQQSKVGTFVPRNQLRAGDLIFSDTNRDGVINHVSIYMGNGQLLHTYRVGIGVTISKFAGSAWDRTYVTARRVIR
jgi:peptidoglycan endopeptidase LytE